MKNESLGLKAKSNISLISKENCNNIINNININNNYNNETIKKSFSNSYSIDNNDNYDNNININLNEFKTKNDNEELIENNNFYNKNTNYYYNPQDNSTKTIKDKLSFIEIIEKVKNPKNSENSEKNENSENSNFLLNNFDSNNILKEVKNSNLFIYKSTSNFHNLDSLIKTKLDKEISESILKLNYNNDNDILFSKDGLEKQLKVLDKLLELTKSKILK